MRISVVMPAYNEAEGISGFLIELREALSEDFEPSFIVVNDASKDGTAAALRALADDGFPVECHTNEVNSGHGVSTRRALSLGVESGCEVIVAIDGDGQFTGPDVARCVETLASNPMLQVVEGVRTSRDDPIYRRATSSATRMLVWSRSHERPADANTPLRAYRCEALRKLLASVPKDVSTPNLFFSALSRRWCIPLAEVEVKSIPRRGSVAAGSTWGATTVNLPTRRFLKFCGRATLQWFTTPMTRPLSGDGSP